MFILFVISYIFYPLYFIKILFRTIFSIFRTIIYDPYAGVEGNYQKNLSGLNINFNFNI